MSLVPNRALEGAAGNQGYNLQRSLRFRSSASAYLNRTPASAGNRQKWTYSGWVKLGSQLSSGNQYLLATASSTSSPATPRGHVAFYNNNLVFYEFDGSNAYGCGTTAVFRDPSAWYHVVFAYDTTQATSTDRFKIYVNGVLMAINSALSPVYPPQNYNGAINVAQSTMIGNTPWPSAYMDGYLAEVNFIDGQALTPSSFGETDTATGVWKPKKYGGTYGTNGFYLPFSDNTSATTLAYDKSGNGNNWTPNNISTTAGATYDSMTDVPTLTSATAANFATLNPLDSYDYSGGAVGTYVTDANLKLAWTATAGQKRTFSTIAMPTSGKWYFEVQVLTTSANGNPIGISPITTNTNQNLAVGAATGEFAFECADGNKVSAGTATSYGTAPSTNDVVMCAVDIDNAKIWWGKQGTWFASGDPAAGTNAAFTTLSQTVQYKIGGTVRGAVHAYNFGQRPFSYTPPTGFKALNTFNLPDPTIKKPSTQMNALTYTGNGTNNRALTGLGFQPDLVWVKDRTSANSNVLFDSVRGFGGNKELSSNTTGAEGAADTTNYGLVSAVSSDGFSVGIGAVGGGYTNGNGDAYVGWCWKKGATPGFDIVTYTGDGTNRNISHNLGVAPSMIIVKSRNATNGWYVCHVGSWGGDGNGLFLNNTASTYNRVTDLGGTGITAMTSSYFTATTGSGTFLNTSGTTYVAYVFAAIPGMSAFGSYTGNGSTDGPFVYCGFRPKYLLRRRTDNAAGWDVVDTTRNPYNAANAELQPNDAGGDNVSTSIDTDLLSNGFKMRNTANGNLNASGGTYIYAAFAENPFKYSLAR